MSSQRKLTIKICQRADYFLFNNSARSIKISRHESCEIAAQRELIARCYGMS